MPNKRTEQPWERQKGESAQAFEAFSLYLEMGADRSIRAVGQRLGKSRQQIGKWSSAYNWVERCQAWDNYLQHEAKKAAVTEVRKMTQRHILMAQQIQNAAMLALKEMGSDMVTPKNFAAVIKLSTELERQNREAEAAFYSPVPEDSGSENNLLEALRGIGEINTDDLSEVD